MGINAETKRVVRMLDFTAIKGYSQQKMVNDREHRTVINRGQIEKVLKCEKPLRDQVILELAAYEGLRSGEISAQHAEWIDFQNGDLYVLDSKKHQLFPLPLVPLVAKHVDQYMIDNDITSGILLKQFHPHRRKDESKSRGMGMTEHHLSRICYFYCDECHVPRVPLRYLRAYFALELLREKGCKLDGSPVSAASILELMMWLRHSNPNVTMSYLETIRDYQTFKTMFVSRLDSPIQRSVCATVDRCPVAIPGKCFCKFYVPSTIAQVEASIPGGSGFVLPSQNEKR